MTRNEIVALAIERYAGADSDHDRVFLLLVDTGDAYLAMMESSAADDPAPFFAGSTPLEMLMNGLRENLDLRRGGNT